MSVNGNGKHSPKTLSITQKGGARESRLLTVDETNRICPKKEKKIILHQNLQSC